MQEIDKEQIIQATWRLMRKAFEYGREYQRYLYENPQADDIMKTRFVIQKSIEINEMMGLFE